MPAAAVSQSLTRTAGHRGCNFRATPLAIKSVCKASRINDARCRSFSQMRRTSTASQEREVRRERRSPFQKRHCSTFRGTSDFPEPTAFAELYVSRSPDTRTAHPPFLGLSDKRVGTRGVELSRAQLAPVQMRDDRSTRLGTMARSWTISGISRPRPAGEATS